jgi:nitroreductase
MDVLTAIRSRRSIRSYAPQPVEEGKLQLVLEAGRLAPSAVNRQDWRFVLVQDQETIRKLTEAAGRQSFVATAPAVLVACGTDPDKLMRCGQYTYNIDVSIALSFMVLEATELGLGTCWLGNFDEGQVKEILGIPAHERVVAMTPLGYPAEQPAPRPRNSMDQFAAREKY